MAGYKLPFSVLSPRYLKFYLTHLTIGTQLTGHKLILLAARAEPGVEPPLEPLPVPPQVFEALLRERSVREAVVGYGLSSHLKEGQLLGCH